MAKKNLQVTISFNWILTMIPTLISFIKGLRTKSDKHEFDLDGKEVSGKTFDLMLMVLGILFVGILALLLNNGFIKVDNNSSIPAVQITDGNKTMVEWYGKSTREDNATNDINESNETSLPISDLFDKNISDELNSTEIYLEELAKTAVAQNILIKYPKGDFRQHPKTEGKEKSDRGCKTCHDENKKRGKSVIKKIHRIKRVINKKPVILEIDDRGFINDKGIVDIPTEKELLDQLGEVGDKKEVIKEILRGYSNENIEKIYDTFKKVSISHPYTIQDNSMIISPSASELFFS